MAFPPSRVVKTAYGKVQGRRLVYEGEKRVDAFQGIPFAAPPVGELRFKKPVPPATWEGVREATAFAARSIQQPRVPNDVELNGVPSEDCLYLNIFTPFWEAAEGGFPVMVYIHGGGFVNGEPSSNGDIGICENIVSRGVVFVTFAYRLGYLGFFSTGDAICPGNLGLWDQVEALKWVQMNIAAFGGNKDNITLLGQSAGGASVDLLHISPHSTHLFHKAICMAGTAENRWVIYPDMPLQSRQHARKLGISDLSSSSEMIAKLRQLPAMDFGTDLFSKEKPDNADFTVAPCMDGDFFPEPLDALRAKATPKPFLTGVTKEEGLLMIPGRESTAEGLEETLTEAVRECIEKEAMKAELRHRFIKDLKPDDPKFMRAMAEITSDAFYDAGILEHCRKIVALQSEPLFLYVMDHFNPSILGFLASMMPIQDSTHTCELFYLFKKGLIGTPELDEVEMRVMDLFTTALTNFAKFGNPNGSNSAHTNLPTRWEPISRENPELNFVITSGEPRMDDAFFEGRTAAFIDIRNIHK